ncbi:MAG: hypothetical protein JWQ79_1480 [Mucilaginibacter sp.]|jgi:hypothetical protein|nr:hypothetical protein [Mucilaginibacter sp.]
MIGVAFYGRLGNQIFQFYYYLYLKSINKNKWVFMPNPTDAYLFKYFDLGPDNFIGTKLYWIFARIAAKIFKFKDVYVQNFHLPKAPAEIAGNTIFHGYFQTDWYINNTPNPFIIKLKEKYTKRFDQEFGAIFNNEKTIVVHIRRTDYLTYGKRDISLPITYFKKCLETIDDLDSYRIFFCSDDMPFVKNAFPDKPNYIFSENDEITDFQILMNADIAIISNSSFAWWATYLSKKNNKVIAPKNWLGFRIGKEHPKCIMTKKFNWHAVLDEN